MKILLLTSDQPNQWGLANKINSLYPLSEIAVVSSSYRKQKTRSLNFWLRKLNNGLGELITFAVFRKCWFGMLNHYSCLYEGFPVKPKVLTDNVNSNEVFQIIDMLRPDLTVVSGTNLLGTGLIKKVQEYGKIVNLHTGISPYIKGGPSCTNWCFYLGRPDLIGNTVMWINEGIDSGNIIATEKTVFCSRDSLLNIHIKVMEHGHDLYLRSIQKIITGEELPDINQNELSPHRLFLGKDWKTFHRVKALCNYLWMRYLCPKSTYNCECVYPVQRD